MWSRCSIEEMDTSTDHSLNDKNIIDDIMKKTNLEKIELESVILVEFEERMIGKYCEWMQDEFLLQATCTEPMGREEVESLCLMWKTDPCKYTYIICDKIRYDLTKPEISMIGDVNLFVDDELNAEINVMLAEESYRGKGIAAQVVNRVLRVAKEVLGLRRVIAKINESNRASERLFAKLGFVEYDRIQDFGEIHYEYCLSQLHYL